MKLKSKRRLLAKTNRNSRKTQNIRGKRKYKGGIWEGSRRQKLYRYLNPFYTSNVNNKDVNNLNLTNLLNIGNKLVQNDKNRSNPNNADLDTIEQLIDNLATKLTKTDDQTKMTSINNANACKYCIGKKLLDQFQDNRNSRNRIPDEIITIRYPTNTKTITKPNPGFKLWYKGCIMCDPKDTDNIPIINLIQQLMKIYNNCFGYYLDPINNTLTPTVEDIDEKTLGFPSD